jgi:hypothetical protein
VGLDAAEAGAIATPSQQQQYKLSGSPKQAVDEHHCLSNLIRSTMETLSNGSGSRLPFDECSFGLQLGKDEPLDIKCVDRSVDESRQSGSWSEKTSHKPLLKAKREEMQYLPGQPRIRLGTAPDSYESQDELVRYLRDSHLTKELDGLLPFMKYIFVRNTRLVAVLQHNY